MYCTGRKVPAKIFQLGFEVCLRIQQNLKPFLCENLKPLGGGWDSIFLMVDNYCKYFLACRCSPLEVVGEGLFIFEKS